MDSRGSAAVGMTGESAQGLPLRLTFVISAYDTAQRMIRFSDEKASFVFLFFGIILSIFGIRGDRILLILGGEKRPGAFHALFIGLFLAFFATLVVALFHGLKTIAPRLDAPPADPGRIRLYWFRDVLDLPMNEYLDRLQSLSGEAVLEAMTSEMYAVMAIERAKFSRVSRCLRWAVVSFVLWILVIAMTIVT